MSVEPGAVVIQPEMVPLFSVPFARSRYPQHQNLNQLLKRVIAREEKSGRPNPRPYTQRNSTVFESDFNFFRLQDPAVQELKGFCWNQLLWLVAKLNDYDEATVQSLDIYNDCWFHVTRRGGFFGLHNHPNASWSGVYCVDSGGHDSDGKATGALNFVNPMLNNAMYMDAANANLKLPYSLQIASASLEAGQLVLFPSWLLHDVKPYEGVGERITIAFNCWFAHRRR